MADNVGYTEGVGTLVATDDVGGVQYQVIKLDIGGDGLSQRVIGTFPVSGSVTANLGTVAGLALDATVATTNANLGAVGDAVWSGTGNATAISALKGIWSAITNNSLPAGTNAIGTVTAVGNAASGAADSGNPVKVGAVFSTTLPTVTNGQRVDAQATARGERLVAISNGAVAATVKAASTAAATTDTALVVSMAGANSATKIGDGTNNAAIKAASTAAVATDPALVVTFSPNTGLPSSTNSIGVVRVGDTSVSSTLGGYTTFHTLVSAATTNATSVKATPGTIAFLSLSNTSATPKYFKLCNTAAAPTPGTTSPSFNIMIPSTSTIQLTYVVGHRCTSGISYMVTGGSALLDTTAVAAGDVLVNIGYS